MSNSAFSVVWYKQQLIFSALCHFEGHEFRQHRISVAIWNIILLIFYKLSQVLDHRSQTRVNATASDAAQLDKIFRLEWIDFLKKLRVRFELVENLFFNYHANLI